MKLTFLTFGLTEASSQKLLSANCSTVVAVVVAVVLRAYFQVCLFAMTSSKWTWEGEGVWVPR